MAKGRESTFWRARLPKGKTMAGHDLVHAGRRRPADQGGVWGALLCRSADSAYNQEGATAGSCLNDPETMGREAKSKPSFLCGRGRWVFFAWDAGKFKGRLSRIVVADSWGQISKGAVDGAARRGWDVVRT